MGYTKYCFSFWATCRNNCDVRKFVWNSPSLSFTLASSICWETQCFWLFPLCLNLLWHISVFLPWNSLVKNHSLSNSYGLIKKCIFECYLYFDSSLIMVAYHIQKQGQEEDFEGQEDYSQDILNHIIKVLVPLSDSHSYFPFFSISFINHRTCYL